MGGIFLFGVIFLCGKVVCFVVICCFLWKDGVIKGCWIFNFWEIGVLLLIIFGFWGLGSMFFGVVKGWMIEELWVIIICWEFGWLFWCGNVIFCILIDVDERFKFVFDLRFILFVEF